MLSSLRGGGAVMARSGLKTKFSSPLGSFSSSALRWKSDDAGDVIGIDLGTTNSCVAIMVSHISEGILEDKWKGERRERGRGRRERSAMGE